VLKENFVLNKLKAGKTVLGTWVVIPSVVNIDIITSTGLDFVIIDREHGPIGFEKAQEMAIACESNGASPIMRVGDIDKAASQNVLDIGMHGIQVPNIDTITDAEKVIEYSKYPPRGNRGFSPFTRAGGYSIYNSEPLMKTANDNSLVVLNIEGLDAINNVDDILAIDGVDVLFVGLFDLSKALGVPGDVENPLIMEALELIIQKANKAGKYVGTIATSFERVRFFKSIGVKYLVYLVDCDMLRSAYSSVIEVFEEDKF